MNEEILKVEIFDINYIPSYKVAEEERQSNELERIANEEERQKYYQEIQDKVNNGEFKGETGPQGPQGETGPQGPAGVDGTVTFEELTEEQKESLRGPQGEQGLQGEVGPAGVYLGETEPIDENVNVWIDPNGSPEVLADNIVFSDNDTLQDKYDNGDLATKDYVDDMLGDVNTILATLTTVTESESE